MLKVLTTINIIHLTFIELGLNEKNVHEKYLGTIFTKQQTGFNPDSQTLLQKGI